MLHMALYDMAIANAGLFLCDIHSVHWCPQFAKHMLYFICSNDMVIKMFQ